MENFWCAARLQPRREALATHCLGLAGYEIYLPRLREHRRIRGRSVEVRPPLFPGYIFVLIVLQWSAARYSPGIATLVMNGGGPARVPDRVIDEIRSRERGGLIELPEAARTAARRQGPDRAGTVLRPPRTIRRHG